MVKGTLTGERNDTGTISLKSTYLLSPTTSTPISCKPRVWIDATFLSTSQSPTHPAQYLERRCATRCLPRTLQLRRREDFSSLALDRRASASLGLTFERRETLTRMRSLIYFCERACWWEFELEVAESRQSPFWRIGNRSVPDHHRKIYLRRYSTFGTS